MRGLWENLEQRTRQAGETESFPCLKTARDRIGGKGKQNERDDLRIVRSIDPSLISNGAPFRFFHLGVLQNEHHVGEFLFWGGNWGCHGDDGDEN